MIWKRLKEYPAYEVSESGLVRRISAYDVLGRYVGRTPLKQGMASGYPYVCLTTNGKQRNEIIHVLVLLAFHGPKPSSKHQGAHFPDRTKTNNHYTNLRWASKRENESDKKIHGTSDSNLQEIDVIIIRQQLRMKLKSGNELARIFRVSTATISEIRKRKTWKYLEEFVGSEGKSILESAEGHLFYSEDYGDIDACALMNDLREYSL